MGYPALFYNAIDNDRTYDADSFERWLKKFFTSGVFAGDLSVTAGGGMTVSVATGYANTDGKVRFFDEATTLTIGTAHATLNRIDNIVIERNDTERDITLKVVAGTPASTPTPTAPVRSNGVYQLILARVRVPAGATSVTNSMITDTRVPSEGEDPVLCGVVATALGEVDVQAFFSLYRAQFLEWFDELQDVLDENTAAHLQSEIMSVRNSCIEFTGLDLIYNSDTGLYEYEFTDSDISYGTIHITEDMHPEIFFTEDTIDNIVGAYYVETNAGSCVFSCTDALSATVTGRIILYPTNVYMDEGGGGGSADAASVAETLEYLGIT